MFVMLFCISAQITNLLCIYITVYINIPHTTDSDSVKGLDWRRHGTERSVLFPSPYKGIHIFLIANILSAFSRK